MDALLSLIMICLTIWAMRTLIGLCLCLIRFVLRWLVILALVYALIQALV